MDGDAGGLAPVPLPALRTLHGVITRLYSGRDERETAQAVADGALATLGFGVVAVNLVQDHGDLEIVAVAGSESARTALLGRRGARADWDRLLAAGVGVGRLRFVEGIVRTGAAVPLWSNPQSAPGVPTARAGEGDPGHPFGAGAWHAEDALLAPLVSPEFGLLGVLSVDEPQDGRRPGRLGCELLEMFAAQAVVAVENLRLHAEVLRRERARSSMVDQLRTMVRGAPVPIVQVDLEGRVQLWNAEAERTFGWTEDEVRGRVNPCHGGDEEGWLADLRRLERQAGPARTEAVCRRRDGSPVWVDQSWGVQRDPDGSPSGFIGAFVDMTERRRLEEDLRHAAQHDILTGLANRAHLEERATQALARSARRGSRVGLLLLDLDDFKTVNDQYGHAAGDEVLRVVAGHLRAFTRPEDTVGRFGGDEFVVLLEDQEDDVSRVADRVARACRAVVDGIEVTASVGYAVSQGAMTVSDLLREADASMYAVKRARRAALRAGGARAERRTEGAEAPGFEPGMGGYPKPH